MIVCDCFFSLCLFSTVTRPWHRSVVAWGCKVNIVVQVVVVVIVGGGSLTLLVLSSLELKVIYTNKSQKL